MISNMNIKGETISEKKMYKKLTSPQPYTEKCFENIVEVARIQYDDLLKTVSLKSSGNSSPSFSAFLRPDSRECQKGEPRNIVEKKNISNQRDVDLHLVLHHLSLQDCCVG
jgi:hypothetical protein